MIFSTIQVLDSLIAAYFTQITGKYHFEDLPAKGKNTDDFTRQKVWDQEPEPPTISELAFYLGFESRAAFEQYELTGEFPSAVKRARLRVEAAYEKKLHQQSSTGAIFALKNMGWGERDKPVNQDAGQLPVLEIKIHDSGIATAGDEREVVL